MPLADGLMVMAPHPGQGELLSRVIDPSVATGTIGTATSLAPSLSSGATSDSGSGSTTAEPLVRRAGAA